MVGESVQTDVDLLVSLVKEKGKVSIEAAAKALKVPIDTVQTWVDFLIEEEVLGIEYKFVTPYLFFNKEPGRKEGDVQPVEEKEEFIDKAKRRGLPVARVNSLWQKYMQSNIEEIRENFFIRAKEKGATQQQLETLWVKYQEYLRAPIK